MSKTSRKKVRAAIVSGLEAYLADISADKISGYQPTLDGRYPLIAVLGKSSRRPRLTLQGTKTEFVIHIVVYVVREADALSRSQAEDLLDDTEARIGEYLENICGAQTYWSSLDYDSPSDVSLFVTEGGLVYLAETIAVTATLLR